MDINVEYLVTLIVSLLNIILHNNALSLSPVMSKRNLPILVNKSIRCHLLILYAIACINMPFVFFLVPCGEDKSLLLKIVHIRAYVCPFPGENKMCVILFLFQSVYKYKIQRIGDIFEWNFIAYQIPTISKKQNKTKTKTKTKAKNKTQSK